MDQKNLPDLSDLGKYVFELGLESNLTDLPPHSHAEFNAQLALSIECDIIARSLLNAWWILNGRQGCHNFAELSVALQQRYRYLAERAIATIDPKVRLDFQQEAALETSDWMNGPYDAHNMPSNEDIANFAISSYEAKLAGVRVEMEREK